MTEGDGRSTWRPGRYSPCPRRDAGHYLAFLGGLGYPLSDIEQTIIDGTPYTGPSLADSLCGSDDLTDPSEPHPAEPAPVAADAADDGDPRTADASPDNSGGTPGQAAA